MPNNWTSPCVMAMPARRSASRLRRYRASIATPPIASRGESTMMLARFQALPGDRVQRLRRIADDRDARGDDVACDFEHQRECSPPGDLHEAAHPAAEVGGECREKRRLARCQRLEKDVLDPLGIGA